MPFVENLTEWKARHGNNGIHISGRVIYGDGAQSDFHGMVLMEPPTDQGELLRLRLEYLQAKLERVENEFELVKTDQLHRFELSRKFSNLPGPSELAAEYMRKLQLKARLLRNGIESVTERLRTATPQAQQQQVHANLEADRVARQRAIAAEINNLQI